MKAIKVNFTFEQKEILKISEEWLLGNTPEEKRPEKIILFNLDASGLKRKFYEENFSEALLVSVNFSGLDLSGSDFSGATLKGCKFDTSLLDKANFSESTLENCSFEGAVLSFAHINRALIHQTPFDKAKNVIELSLENSRVLGQDLPKLALMGAHVSPHLLHAFTLLE